MTHLLNADYQDGWLRLESPLPLEDGARVRVSIEVMSGPRESILDIPPVSVGAILTPAPEQGARQEMLDERS